METVHEIPTRQQDHGHDTNSTWPHLVETYSGPSVHDMIASHTLAENIIKYDSQILDAEEMVLLKRFVNEPESRDQILAEIGIENVEGVTGRYHGSLAGYIIMRHKSEVGETIEPVLTNDEIERLKEWFRTGQEQLNEHTKRCSSPEEKRRTS